MRKNQMIDLLRSQYPDMKWFKKCLVRFRIKWTTRMLLSNEQIELAEQDINVKNQLVEQCKKRWPKIYGLTEKKCNEVLDKAPEFAGREDKTTVYNDIVFCRFAYGFQPDEYLCCELENKSMQERKAIISDTDRYCYVYQMNDISAMQTFNNKGKTYNKFKKYYGRDALYIKNRRDYRNFCSFIERHPTFVSKDVFGGMGKDVELVNTRECKISEKKLFQDMMVKGPRLLEERVVQNNVMGVLNPSSVNTVRCITLNTMDGIVVSYCFLKVGRKGSFVDNGGSGGILVGIDKKYGKLNTDGYDELNVRYVTHPDSGVNLKGYQLPDWEQLIHMCVEMSGQMPTVKYIGWDLAYTDTGWIVIEGNGMSQMIGPQIVWRNRGGYSRRKWKLICGIWNWYWKDKAKKELFIPYTLQREAGTAV